MHREFDFFILRKIFLHIRLIFSNYEMQKRLMKCPNSNAAAGMHWSNAAKHGVTGIGWPLTWFASQALHGKALDETTGLPQFAPRHLDSPPLDRVRSPSICSPPERVRISETWNTRDTPVFDAIAHMNAHITAQKNPPTPTTMVITVSSNIMAKAASTGPRRPHTACQKTRRTGKDSKKTFLLGNQQQPL